MTHARSIQNPLATLILILAACAGSILVFLQPAVAQPTAAIPLEAATHDISPLERRLIQAGFVDVRALDPDIMVDLEYARVTNFIGENVYGSMSRAYLRPEAAAKLAHASQILRKQHTGLRILVTDAVRPRSIQHKMWRVVAGTPRQPYIANPNSGSMHNYGVAVDVTLYDVENDRRLDMGTPIYFLGPLAEPKLEGNFLRDGKLTEHQIANRRILRKALCEAGWHSLSIEWWHFEAFPRDYIRRNFYIFE